MTVRVKICGLNAPDAVDAAVAAGADWLGFIIFPRSPRAVSPEQAGALAARKGAAKSVAVLVDPDDAVLGEVLRHMRPDIIQLHGQESPERCLDARAYAGEAVWKAFGIASRADADAAAAYQGFAEGFVCAPRPPTGPDRPGGWGRGYDWSVMSGYEAAPWLLSGGLDPENVAEAVRVSGAEAVDVASGVESAPGVKDLAAIARFLAAAKAA
jgi:phosphoribosylanthranilate isomerase